MSRNTIKRKKQQKKKNNESIFAWEIQEIDQQIKDLSIKITEEKNTMAKSLLISLSNDLILRKNKIILKAFRKISLIKDPESANFIKYHFNKINRETIIVNDVSFLENLKIREANPEFSKLEYMIYENIDLAIDKAKNSKEKMVEPLLVLEELI